MRTLSLFGENPDGTPAAVAAVSIPRTPQSAATQKQQQQQQLQQRRNNQQPPPQPSPFSRNRSLPKLTLNVSPLTASLASHPPSQSDQQLQQPQQHPLHATTNETIQAIWAHFDAMTDVHRNTLLKGIVKRCAEAQVRAICTSLNLKMVDDDCGQVIHPETGVMTGKRSEIPGVKPRRPKPSHPSSTHPATSLLLGGTIEPTFFSALAKAAVPPTTPGSTFHIPTTAPGTAAAEKIAPATDGSFARSSTRGPGGGDVDAVGAAANINLYAKLLQSSSSDVQVLAKHLAQRRDANTTGTVAAFVGYLTRTVQTFRSVLQTLSTVSSSSDAAEIISTVFVCAKESVDAQYATLYVVDENADTDTLCVRASNWLAVNPQTTSTSCFNTGRIPTPRIYAAGALMKGEVVCVGNVKTSDQFMEDLHAGYEKLDPECILSVPLVVQRTGRVVAVLELINKARTGATPYFNDQDEFVARALGSIWSALLSPLLEAAAAYNQNLGDGGGSHGGAGGDGGGRNAHVRAIIDTASVMSTELDLADLITTIMKTVQELLSAERASLFIVDEEKQELWTTVAQGTQEIRVPLNKGIAGYVATSAKTLNIPNAYKDPRFNREIDNKTGFRTRNILCMPMRNAQGRVIGVTQIINKLPAPNTPFGKDDELLLASFSTLAGGMLDKTMILKTVQKALLQSQSTLSSLTSALLVSPVLLLHLNHAGRLISSTPHPTLTIAAGPLPSIASYETWLGADNGGLVRDIAAVYDGRGGRVYGVGEVFVNDDGLRVVVDWVVEMVPENKGLLVAVGVVNEEVRRTRAIRRYFSTEDTPHVLRSNLDKGIRGIASVVSTILPETDLDMSTPAPQVLSDLTATLSPIHQSAAQNHGLVYSQTPTTATILFHSTALGSTSVPATPSPATAARNALLTALQIRHTSPRAAIVICTGSVVSGLWGGNNNDWACIGSPTHRTHLLHALSELYTPALSPFPSSRPSTTTTTTTAFAVDTPLILVDAPTADLVAGSFHIRELDALEVVPGVRPQTPPVDGGPGAGVQIHLPDQQRQQQLMVVHQVLADGKTPLDQSVLTALICYELGLSEYRMQNFRVAAGHFEKAVAITDDAPARVMFDRCSAVMDGAVVLPDPWDGVWRWE
ncbi:hypothetical protein PhCBS80983_g04533 [Powellomyces hirtus]|uniref:GAF domain-containing protein n=1 Tax=Powellomyces hirtus TaxID=109895 RepID=A0A507DXH8_9FUNG|nr:hypothetical protein PhCBS80983_g04533 [Powellomyces hirtus]